jgi:hypothetical protein
MPSLLLTPSFRAFLGGVLGASIGVQETMLITAIAPLFSVLWLIWSPVIRQGRCPSRRKIRWRRRPLSRRHEVGHGQLCQACGAWP